MRYKLSGGGLLARVAAQCGGTEPDAAALEAAAGSRFIGYRPGESQDMPASLFEEIKRCVGLTAEDEENLRFLADPLAGRIDAVVEEIYGQLDVHPAARSAIRESGASPARVRMTIEGWVAGMLGGPYDDRYFSRRKRLGEVHMRLRLPQHFMVAALSLFRLALVDEVKKLGLPGEREKLRSLHKIIAVETAIIMEAFREGYAERVRQAERQALKERLEESEHLANIGQLAATLAHEIKNPLAGISGAIQVLAGGLEGNDPRRGVVGEILSQIDRLDAIVRDLLIYARPKPPARTRNRVGQVIQRTLVLLQGEPALENVQIRSEGLDSTAEALIDENQFQQLMTNLLLNSVQACDHGGDISVRLTSRNSVVRVEVVDTGKGMSDQEAARAFEPFFTTKSKGTGLGLPICKRIIEAHDGRIQMQSRPGKGTKVTIELPSDPFGSAQDGPFGSAQDRL